MQIIQAVPTNIITGFLGVGKTTAILSLLQQRPAGKRWAILVNEFGEVGIDGALLTGQGGMLTGQGGMLTGQGSSPEVSIKEVPGGCMCCVAGLPMQVGLQRLLAQSRPDRLIIEPTGLGHPREVLAVLQRPEYRNVLDVRATITLVDPRKLSNEKYRSHPIFNDQIAVADVLVANKIDLANDDDVCQFELLVAAQSPAKQKIAKVQQAQIELAWLDLPCHLRSAAAAFAVFKPGSMLSDGGLSEIHIPDGENFIRKESAPIAADSSNGYGGCGWVFRAERAFDYMALFACLSNLNALRVKAVMNTNRGWVAFNADEDVLTTKALDASIVPSVSQLEVVHDDLLDWDKVEAELMQACVNMAD